MIASCLRSRISSIFGTGESREKRPSRRERPIGLYPTAQARWRGLEALLDALPEPSGLSVTFMSRKTDK